MRAAWTNLGNCAGTLALAVLLGACSEPRDLSGPCEDCTASVHPPGILDPDSAAFHASELARRGWDLKVCASCHGDDFAGGRSGVSCTTCHTAGPTACVTCHQDGPTSGAHATHLAAQFACAECHTVPTAWDSPGHILNDTPPAEVVFAAGSRAQLTPVAPDREGPAAFADGSCANIYCHGGTLHAGGAMVAPLWDQPLTPGCASCHGAPPPSHAQSECVTCHPSDAPHIDGTTQIGRTSGCDGCHGSAVSAAPPTDLAGNVLTTALGVGAHQAHLVGPSVPRRQRPHDRARRGRAPGPLVRAVGAARPDDLRRLSPHARHPAGAGPSRLGGTRRGHRRAWLGPDHRDLRLGLVPRPRPAGVDREQPGPLR